jgi:hypothetical protein
MLSEIGRRVIAMHRFREGMWNCGRRSRPHESVQPEPRLGAAVSARLRVLPLSAATRTWTGDASTGANSIRIPMIGSSILPPIANTSIRVVGPR